MAAAVDKVRIALDETGLLKLVDETDHVTTVESKRLRQVALRKTRAILGHRQYGVMTRC